ncbi:efflux RND transporter periplasmic adaptor subunit [uncultured Propionivibrio sp.]|uniref:efflux RND transporter periplasmic adaptor subunit n=1 Tax=uncultured Propionivibrio sp. TaxID=426737 RepID=UPI0029C0924A|nr:efflux RND transporter periplasmic adaptor subunit [uncultured Propionivibrio sp.]
MNKRMNIQTVMPGRVRRGLLALLAAAATSIAVGAEPPASVPVRQDGGGATYVAEGVVEAVRQTVVSAQVPGVISQLGVKAGDVVRSGQMLLQIDARAANQASVASGAQAEAARTAFEVASKDYARQKQLFEKEYISAAAMERAEAQYRAARAQADAAGAQAQASRVQTGFFTLSAPYAGVVTDVSVTLGDMAMPGRALMTLHDPAVLRVTAVVPQSQAERAVPGGKLRIEFPGAPEAQRWDRSGETGVAAGGRSGDAHAATAAGTAGRDARRPAGHFRTRAFAGRGRRHAAAFCAGQSLSFRRAELNAVYVIDGNGRAHLRQVRPGPVAGDEVEILSGLSAGERVAVDPLAAARSR